MTKKEMMEILKNKKIKDDVEIKVLCTRANPIPIECAYFDKTDEQVIIETN